MLAIGFGRIPGWAVRSGPVRGRKQKEPLWPEGRAAQWMKTAQNRRTLMGWQPVGQKERESDEAGNRLGL